MINIACAITMLRIFLTPVVIFFLASCQWLLATIIFTFAAMTDLADGFVARRYNMQTKFGQILDPVADKCLLMGTMYTLLAVIFCSSPSWSWHQLAICFLLAKEMVFLVVGGYLWWRYRFFIAPSVLSRATSIAEIILILICLLSLVLFGVVGFGLLAAVLVVNLMLSAWLLTRYVVVVFKYLI